MLRRSSSVASAAALSAAFGASLKTYRRSSTGSVTALDEASAIVGMRFSPMVRAAPTAHSLQPPMMTALTRESPLKSLMFRKDSAASERLSLILRSILRPPSAPDEFNCSTFSSSARWYTLPTGADAPESSRSAAMTMGLVSCGSPPIPQPVSVVASTADASAAKLAERMGLNSVLQVRRGPTPDHRR